MKPADPYLLNDESTLREALEIIDSQRMKIGLIVSNSLFLKGTITDGDVRRALLRGSSLDDKVLGRYCTTPVVCTADASNEVIIAAAQARYTASIPIVDSDGILVGIKNISEIRQNERRPNKAIIMAGGEGRRLRPLTTGIPKPMLNVGNRPILETIIRNFAANGYGEIILCLNYKAEVIKEHFGDGKKFGTNISYIHEQENLGTAGALSLLETEIAEPFFVMNGDILTNVNFQHLHEFHVQEQATATMCVREFDIQIPYGVAEIDENKGTLKCLKEKPVQTYYVNAGIYMLNPECLTQIPRNTRFDMPSLFSSLIEQNRKASSFPIREYWIDIGRADDFQKANDEYGDFF